MDLIIPTAGRWLSQPTLVQLRNAGLKPTLVVQVGEYIQYTVQWGQMANIKILSPDVVTIAATRQWILENVGTSDKICMLDDDLTFYRRSIVARDKLIDIAPHQLYEAFEQMDHQLEGHPHVGFAAREGANRVTTSVVTNTRIMRVLGYNRRVLLDEGIRFDRIELMEDFDVALQLLEKGHPNLILNNYAHNQAGSGKAGGCSTFRTPAKQAQAAHALAALHPRYVQVVEKTTKGSFGGGTRTDVKIQWKKAYNDAVGS